MRKPMHLKLHKGALHRSLGVPESRKIPDSMLAQAKHSKNQHVRKMANLAASMKHWKKGIHHSS